MLYAGRDATEEFNMIHDPKVVAKYAASTSFCHLLLQRY